MAISSNASRRAFFGAAAAALAGAEPPRLPFQLRPADLRTLRLTLRAASTKPNAPQDGIVIHGDGAVTLQSGSHTRSGQLPPGDVVHLLELLRREGMERWQDVYPSASSHYAAQVIRLEVADEVRKQTEVRREAFPAFTRAVAAIKAAGIRACPDAAAGFFQRL